MKLDERQKALVSLRIDQIIEKIHRDLEDLADEGAEGTRDDLSHENLAWIEIHKAILDAP